MRTTSTFTITNPGNIPSEPVITVTGSGDITLMVGTTIIELEGISGGITIDTPLMEAYKGAESLNAKMTGDFPTLPSGSVPISTSGSVTRVTIKPNWRLVCCDELISAEGDANDSVYFFSGAQLHVHGIGPVDSAVLHVTALKRRVGSRDGAPIDDFGSGSGLLRGASSGSRSSCGNPAPSSCTDPDSGGVRGIYPRLNASEVLRLRSGRHEVQTSIVSGRRAGRRFRQEHAAWYEVSCPDGSAATCTPTI